MFNKLSYKYGEYFYLIFRLLIGILFFMHGAQKLFGGQPVPITGLFGIAGIIEVVAGILIFVGFLTKPVVLITAIEMLVAYFKVHLPQGFNPLLNQGEPALLFFAAFLVLLVKGSGKYSLDQLFFKSEI